MQPIAELPTSHHATHANLFTAPHAANADPPTCRFSFALPIQQISWHVTQTDRLDDDGDVMHYSLAGRTARVPGRADPD
jgi:hypothetical protein